jgi:hypothetical protein
MDDPISPGCPLVAAMGIEPFFVHSEHLNLVDYVDHTHELNFGMFGCRCGHAYTTFNIQATRFLEMLVYALVLHDQELGSYYARTAVVTTLF